MAGNAEQSKDKPYQRPDQTGRKRCSQSSHGNDDGVEDKKKLGSKFHQLASLLLEEAGASEELAAWAACSLSRLTRSYSKSLRSKPAR